MLRGRNRRTKTRRNQLSRRRLTAGLQRLEDRHLLAAEVMLFADSFESGADSKDWSGNWVEDGQNAWLRSSQRSTDGSVSAEVDGFADDATLTMADSIDLSGYAIAELQFDWYIESGFDVGEYLALDISKDGGLIWETDVRILSENVNVENTWHHETFELSPDAFPSVLVRFRSLVDRGIEDANVDNVRIVGIPDNASPIGLISHWTADNTSLDAEGNNDGTVVSGAAYTTGQIGEAFSFDGVDDRVLIDDSLSLRLTKSMTIEGWVRVDSFPSTGHGLVLFRGDDRDGLDPYQLTTTPNGEIHFGISSLTGGMTVAAPMPQGEFVYVAATLDDATGEMSLYLNGLRMAQKITSERPFGALDPGSNPGIGIGNHGGYPTTPHNFPFHGAIDELKIYDVPLSADDVLANFNAGKGSLQPSISINDASVVEGDSGYTFSDAFVSLGSSGGLGSPRGITFGPDGNLYVASTDTNSVLRYNAATGTFMDEFVPGGSGGLDYPRDLSFHDGDLFVVSDRTNSVLRFKGTNGVFIEEFVASGSGGLEAPRGLLFGTNNDLYVTSAGEDDAVLLYNATTGDFIDEFIASGDHGMNNPTRVVIGPDNLFYVTSTNVSSNSVLRYDQAGNFIDVFVSSGVGGLDGPTDILFKDGLMYVASARGDSVLAFDQTTGDFAGVVVASASGGLDNPNSMLIDDDGRLYLTSRATHEVLRYEERNASELTITLSWPSASPVTVNFHTEDISAQFGSDYESTTGTVTFLPGETSQSISIPVLSDETAETDETFRVVLTNPINAILTDQTGVVTIVEATIAIEDVTVTEGMPSDPFVFGTAGIDGAFLNALAFGPDGDLFVGLGSANGLSNSVMRFDGTTGDPQGTFVTQNWMGTTRDLLFRDGVLYVADLNAPTEDAVKMFDATTGQPLGTFVGDDPATSVDETGGLKGAEGLVFGPDANEDGQEDLYVTGWRSNNILVYDGLTGSYIDTIVSGISAPHGIEVHNGNLLVTSQTNQVLEYRPDGTFVRAIGSTADGLSNPIDIAIGPNDQYLYVTSGSTSKVVRYDLGTGAYIDDVATAQDGLDYSRSLTFQNGALYVTSINNDDVVRIAVDTLNEVALTVSMAGPLNSVITVDFATSDDSATAGSDYVATSGSITFAPGQTTRTIVIATLDDTVGEVQETFNVTLSGSGVVTIVEDVAVATIIDDDINNGPVAVDDIADAKTEFEKVVDVLANDFDPDGDALFVESADSFSSQGGTVVINADNTISYTSAPSFTGSDTFNYTISDGQGGLSTGTVSIDVSDVYVVAMHVDFISFQTRKGGKEWRAFFEIHDENGLAVSDASIDVTFDNLPFSGKTDSNGRFYTGWRRLSSGSYQAEVVDLALSGYSWDRTRGWIGDDDEDGLPDSTLSF